MTRDPSRDPDAVADEPWLPAERKLVVWSLVLGIVLLGLLVWASNEFFAP